MTNSLQRRRGKVFTGATYQRLLVLHNSALLQEETKDISK